jgi:hypothetical protein
VKINYLKKLRKKAIRFKKIRKSKIGTDATFMCMKEDAIKNGQLKPAYNLQHGVDSEYITWLTVGPQPTDTNTLIPFLKSLTIKERLT